MQAGTCNGVLVAHQGQLNWLSAQATVLATGGGGQVYAQTTNPPASTGDGVAMTWRGGRRTARPGIFSVSPHLPGPAREPLLF